MGKTGTRSHKCTSLQQNSSASAHGRDKSRRSGMDLCSVTPPVGALRTMVNRRRWNLVRVAAAGMPPTERMRSTPAAPKGACVMSQASGAGTNLNAVVVGTGTGTAEATGLKMRWPPGGVEKMGSRNLLDCIYCGTGQNSKSSAAKWARRPAPGLDDRLHMAPQGWRPRVPDCG